jgi:hypothetical protein
MDPPKQGIWFWNPPRIRVSPVFILARIDGKLVTQTASAARITYVCEQYTMVWTDSFLGYLAHGRVYWPPIPCRSILMRLTCLGTIKYSSIITIPCAQPEQYAHTLSLASMPYKVEQPEEATDSMAYLGRAAWPRGQSWWPRAWPRYSVCKTMQLSRISWRWMHRRWAHACAWSWSVSAWGAWLLTGMTGIILFSV